MQIFIPTMGRPTNQKTLKALPMSLYDRITLVVPMTEVERYKRNCTVCRVQGVTAKGIAATRQWIMENSHDDYLVMLDDDLAFFQKDAQRKIIGATPDEIEKAFKWLEMQLTGAFAVAHAGITIRSLNYQHPGPFMENTRMMHVLAYNRKTVAAAGCSFTKGVNSSFSMDDFHMTLQLLRKGYSNRLQVDFCTNPSASNSEGGASLWRTLATQNASAEALGKLHKGFVKVTAKKAVWKGMEGERKDVIVQWRKAFLSSQT